MIDYEKLAEALGLEVDGLFYGGKFKLDPREYAEGEWGIEYYGDNADWFIPTSTFARLVENSDLLLAHLVEEKVRGLCKENGDVFYGYYCFPNRPESKRHWIRIDSDSCRVEYGSFADSKFAAFAAALVWLAERKG